MAWSDHPDNSNNSLWVILAILGIGIFIALEIWDYKDRVRLDYDTVSEGE